MSEALTRRMVVDELSELWWLMLDNFLREFLSLLVLDSCFLRLRWDRIFLLIFKNILERSWVNWVLMSMRLAPAAILMISSAFITSQIFHSLAYQLSRILHLSLLMVKCVSPFLFRLHAQLRPKWRLVSKLAWVSCWYPDQTRIRSIHCQTRPWSFRSWHFTWRTWLQKF